MKTFTNLFLRNFLRSMIGAPGDWTNDGESSLDLVRAPLRERISASLVPSRRQRTWAVGMDGRSYLRLERLDH